MNWISGELDSRLLAEVNNCGAVKERLLRHSDLLLFASISMMIICLKSNRTLTMSLRSLIVDFLIICGEGGGCIVLSLFEEHVRVHNKFSRKGMFCRGIIYEKRRPLSCKQKIVIVNGIKLTTFKSEPIALLNKSTA